MHRIDGVAAAPGNLFTEGSPGEGVPATQVTAAWLNDIQEELMSVLGEGGIAPIKGDKTQLLQAIQQLITLWEGGLQGVPFAYALRANRIGIVCGTIRQNASDRTKWDYIADTNHTPVGVDGLSAVASGASITINFDETYSRVLSFIAVPDEAMANAAGMTIGASAGLSSAVLQASTSFNGAFTIKHDGAAWVLSSGTGQDIGPLAASYVNGTLTITHNYCRGIGLAVSPHSDGGTVANPYIPVIKTAGHGSMAIQWMDPTTGNILTSAAPSGRMRALLTKQSNAGLILDGSQGNIFNKLDLATGNIWFLGLFIKA